MKGSGSLEMVGNLKLFVIYDDNDCLFTVFSLLSSTKEGAILKLTLGGGSV